MANPMQTDKFWHDKPTYDIAEKLYYENLAKAQLTPLAEEVAKARQRLIEIKHSYEDHLDSPTPMQLLQQQVGELHMVIESLRNTVKSLEARLVNVERAVPSSGSSSSMIIDSVQTVHKADDDDDVDLFASESDEEDASAAKVREDRLAAYNAKKSKKPALIAKSSILLDVKPWDDETDMAALEQSVRQISCDGLLWGTSKLAPLAYGIYKLQILCVIEDDKVSVDWLQEQIQENENFVQSVDIVAFNKI